MKRKNRTEIATPHKYVTKSHDDDIPEPKIIFGVIRITRNNKPHINAFSEFIVLLLMIIFSNIPSIRITIITTLDADMLHLLSLRSD